MKLVFGKGKVSREEIEREAAREIEALIASTDEPPKIDWSVYGLPPDVADPAFAVSSLEARAAAGADRLDATGPEEGSANGAGEADALDPEPLVVEEAPPAAPAARRRAPAKPQAKGSVKRASRTTSTRTTASARSTATRATATRATTGRRNAATAAAKPGKATPRPRKAANTRRSS